MSRARPADTRARIQEAALELFMAKGIEKTSLREIAEELGITKAALYYHFSSKESLVRSFVDPALAEIEALISEAEAEADMSPREFMGRYFDTFSAHRRLIQLMLRDLSGFVNLGLEEKLLGWQFRMRHLVVGRDASPEDQVRAILALGGLQDVAALHPEEIPAEQARRVAVEAAYAALGLREGVVEAGSH